MTETEKISLLAQVLSIGNEIAKMETDGTPVISDELKSKINDFSINVSASRSFAENADKKYEAPIAKQAKKTPKLHRRSETANVKEVKEKACEQTIDEIISEYREQHPNANQKQCIADTGIARSTLYEHWNKCEPSVNVPKSAKKPEKSSKSAETGKPKTKAEIEAEAKANICKYMLDENVLFEFIERRLEQDINNPPTTVSKDHKEMRLHGIVVRNIYNEKNGKKHSPHILMPEDFTYDGLTANEVRKYAEKQGKAVHFIHGTPLSFGFPGIEYNNYMFIYPAFNNSTVYRIQCYRALHPDARQCDCIKDTGMTRNEVQKNWKKAENIL